MSMKNDFWRMKAVLVIAACAGFFIVGFISGKLFSRASEDGPDAIRELMTNVGVLAYLEKNKSKDAIMILQASTDGLVFAMDKGFRSYDRELYQKWVCRYYKARLALGEESRYQQSEIDQDMKRIFKELRCDGQI